MKDPACGTAKLVHDTLDMPYTYKGETTEIKAMSGHYCPACSEAMLDATESARVNAALLDFNKQENASIVYAAFIVNVHKKFALDLLEAGPRSSSEE